MNRFSQLLYITLFVFILFIEKMSPALYVSPTGSDSNSGSKESPLYSISVAVSKMNIGDTLFVRGGTYSYTTTIQLNKIGTDVARYYILAYPGEHPVLDFSGMADADANRGFFLGGSYWYLKGVEIYRAGDNGMKIEGSHNVIELCSFHHNHDGGLQIGLAKDSGSNPGDTAAYNLILNCDSYDNYDPRHSGSNADGFACKLCPGPGNVFKGCRSWENADDGWDCYQSEYPIRVEDCWTWHNGDAKVFDATNWSGNGNGFKLGGNSSYGANNIAIRCISFDNSYGNSNDKGFDQNDNNKGITLLNCLSFLNKKNFDLGNDLSGADNYHIVKNCVALLPVVKNISFCTQTTQMNNSWNLPTLVADTNDFKSLSVELAKAPRNNDGSLPNNDFARLISGSDLIDKGVDVGLPYAGLAPDLGPFETGIQTDLSSYLPQKRIFALEQNYPNPFNPSTKINFSIPVAQFVSLKVYDIMGREIAVVVNEMKDAGTYAVLFNGANLSSGVYVYRISAKDFSQSRKMLLLK